jgi:hypothetical protein
MEVVRVLSEVEMGVEVMAGDEKVEDGGVLEHWYW